MAAVLPPRAPRAPQVTLTQTELERLPTFDTSRTKHTKHRQLQYHSSFIAVEQSLNALFAQYRALAPKPVAARTDADKAALILAWNDYCRDMLAFVRHLKQTVATEGSETTYRIGQLYLQKWVTPYTQLLSQQDADWVDDSALAQKQLIHHPGHIEILAIDKLLSALEAYYQTNQQLIADLDALSKAAKILAAFDYRYNDGMQYATDKQAAQQAFSAFSRALFRLTTTRDTLDRQVKSFDKKFSWFLLGPLMRFFWGTQRKMAHTVMQTVDARISQISSELSHQLSAQGTRLLAHQVRAKTKDAWAGEKLVQLSGQLRTLAMTQSTGDAQNARAQFMDASLRFIQTQQQKPHPREKASGLFVGASLQDELSRYKNCLGSDNRLKAVYDFRQRWRDEREFIETTATQLLAGASKRASADANAYYSRHNNVENGQHYCSARDVLSHLSGWQASCQSQALAALPGNMDCAQQLQAQYEAVLQHAQLLNQPLQLLVCIRRFGTWAQRKRLSEIIDTYLDNYLRYALPETDAMRLLAVISRAGDARQQQALTVFFNSWTTAMLLEHAADKAVLTKMLNTIAYTRQYAKNNGKPKLRHHLETCVNALPVHMLAQLQQTDAAAPATLMIKARHVLEACLGIHSGFSCGLQLQEMLSLSLCYHDDHIVHHEHWQYLTALFTVLDSYQPPYPVAIAQGLQSLTQSVAQVLDYLMQLALTQQFNTLDKLSGFYAPALSQMILFLKRHAAPSMTLSAPVQSLVAHCPDVLTETPESVYGTLLYAAFRQHWQAFCEAGDGYNPDTAEALMPYLNVLLCQDKQVIPDFIYPAGRDAILFLMHQQTVLQLENTPVTATTTTTTTTTTTGTLDGRLLAPPQDEADYRKQLFFLKTCEPDVRARYPHLTAQAVWTPTALQYRETVEQTTLARTATEKCRQCLLWLNQIDFQSELPALSAADYHPRNDDALFACLWHGLLEADIPEYHLMAKKLLEALLRAAQTYLQAYAEEYQVDRFSAAHIDNLRCILYYLDDLYACQTQLLAPAIADADAVRAQATVTMMHAVDNAEQVRRINAVYTLTQTVARHHDVVTLFRGVVPQSWQADWSAFAPFDALDKQRGALDLMSPLKDREKRAVKRLTEQLQYLATGRGQGQFGVLMKWQTAHVKVLKACFNEAKAIADVRREHSRAHVKKLKAMQTLCADSPPVDCQHEARRNSAASVANQLETELLGWVQKICQQTLHDVQRWFVSASVTDGEDGVVAGSAEGGPGSAKTGVPPSGKATRLFVQRIAFIYHIRACQPEQTPAVDGYTRQWLTQSFNPWVEEHAVSLTALLNTFPRPLFKKLVDEKPLPEHANANDNFWKLVDCLHKQQLAAKSPVKRKLAFS